MPEECDWEKVAATVLVLLVLEKKYAEKATVWTLLAAKAKEWLRKALGGTIQYPSHIQPLLKDIPLL